MDTQQSNSRQQVEAARFRSAVSESLVQSVQGNINYLLASILPIGSVIHSMLSESQFQALTSTGWVLADGRSAPTSAFALLTGFTSVPDCRGIFIRGKNYSRSALTGNSDGNQALGHYEADQFATHNHSTHYRTPSAASGGSDGGGDTNRGLNDVNETSGDAGAGTETRPRSITMNVFVRIN